jgi:hypothetical protein
MFKNSNHEQLRALAESLEKNVFNTSFGIRGKKETQIALIHALRDADVIDFEKPIDPDVALMLGIDPASFSRLVYDAFLNLKDRDPQSLSVSKRELTEWNATTGTDVRRDELRFEVPTHIARARLQSYLSTKGIQPEDGRNRLILKVPIERFLNRLPETAEWLEEALELLRTSKPAVAAEIENTPEIKQKLKKILHGSTEFVIKTAVAAAIERGIGTIG